jgi:hypothetical protein
MIITPFKTLICLLLWLNEARNLPGHRSNGGPGRERTENKIGIAEASTYHVVHACQHFHLLCITYTCVVTSIVCGYI